MEVGVDCLGLFMNLTQIFQCLNVAYPVGCSFKTSMLYWVQKLSWFPVLVRSSDLSANHSNDCSVFSIAVSIMVIVMVSLH